jgi:nucleoside-diphosphate-sugar epimerase
MNTTPSKNPLVLINGAAGRFGRVVVSAFAGAGWQVTARVRRAGLVAWPQGVREQLTGAPIDAAPQVIIHAANPPYTQWASQALPLAREAMDIAEQHGALLMLPGNLYNIGSPMPAHIDAHTPLAPSSRKGRTRQAMEDEMAARAARGLRSVVIRAGDFFGGPGTGSWFDTVVVKSLRHGKLVYTGPLDVPHAWAYLPDLAQAFVRVAAQHRAWQGHRQLPFAGYCFTGHSFTGHDLLAGIEAAASALSLSPRQPWRHGALPWGVIRALSPIVPMWREIAEIAYLWHEPHTLDGAALQTLIGPLPNTPAPEALQQALRSLFTTLNGTLKL